MNKVIKVKQESILNFLFGVIIFLVGIFITIAVFVLFQAVFQKWGIILGILANGGLIYFSYQYKNDIPKVNVLFWSLLVTLITAVVGTIIVLKTFEEVYQEFIG